MVAEASSGAVVVGAASAVVGAVSVVGAASLVGALVDGADSVVLVG